MKVFQDETVPVKPVEMQGAVGCRMRCLIGPEDGAMNFTMRQFEVSPAGHTPQHTHDYEHEVFVLEGTGQIVDGQGQVHPLRPGVVVFVPPNELHQFRNTGPGTLKFLCSIPHRSTG
ncbi:MAG TPA: cupin domain-containing protein [Thermoguttaceae bacterium]|nr:cupin domain-containing protein [Thermoguttaceae bacterium]HPP51676.1 cupin domain-containing protein [Thermoguttaceae bacterium]